MKSTLQIAIENYCDKFETSFPIVIIRSKSDDEIIELIKNSIKNNKPITVDYDVELEYQVKQNNNKTSIEII